ncbi:heterokaryon incompatibility protein-domain-containing protein [Crucibulum laeve]|uniref:Heterokaryon incompatibility protein-domain-containing protein n=1 Tax=Crucibulum laeve TaxID=68775 RepID=A0A5C3LIZ2_9AGAR|nr:heterokaryon incompatibility protein-domain-containing protein [Crucibulum laeve]
MDSADDSESDGSDGSGQSDSDEELPPPDSRPHIPIPPLLPVPDNLARPGDRLCDICSDLNLSPESFVVLPSDNDTADQVDDPNIKLGFVQDLFNKPNCPFCRVVLTALGGAKVPSYDEGKAVSVSMSWNTKGSVEDVDHPSKEKAVVRILRPYAETDEGEYLSMPKINLFPEITLLANDSPTSSKAFFVRPIQDQIDFSMVRGWISLCESWHGEACNKSKLLDHKVKNPVGEISSFRLIDVVDNCLVCGPPNCKFVALSYVWGPKPDFLRTLMNNVRELEKPGAFLLPHFHDKLSVTILDAMQVVREINLRYLWIDCLCIVQDDTTGEKLDAITKMDLVYGGAFLTIMAATGIDANAGLPGVRPGTRRYRQPIEQIKPGFRLAFAEIYQNYIKDAAYYTRAWTFQEQQFTKRSLIFIGGQVVFNCTEADQWREDIFCEDELVIGEDFDDDDTDDIGNFEGLIQSYSELSLSYQADIYNAFAGLARYFKTELKTNLCHGIPEIYFDWFLLWYPQSPQERRKLVPSWSWSGWSGQSWPRMWDWYTRRLEMIRRAQRKRTWIIWYHRLAHDSTECVQILPPKSSRSKSKNFYGGHVGDRFECDCTTTSPTPRKLVDAPEYYKDTLSATPGSGFLQFWTVSLLFTVKSSSIKVGAAYSDNGLPHVGIFGIDDRELGTAFVSASWYAANVPGTYEFIIICEGRDERAESGEEDEEEGWRYMVMLIEHHAEWAERIAIGSIGKEDLDQALDEGPVWKEIILA